MNLILEYIDLFYDKADVVQDVKGFLKLLSPLHDLNVIKFRLNDRIKQAELAETGDASKKPAAVNFSNDINQQMHVLTPIKILRYNFVNFKMMRMLGAYNKLDDGERLELVNKIFSTFLQAMEYHPKASSSYGVGA